MRKRAGYGIGLLLLSVLLISCGRSPPSKFYSLSSEPTRNVAAEGVSVGVGPLTVANYLEQPPIVTRITEHRLKMDEFHRWIAPLKDNISNVVITDLQIFLNSNRVYNYPRREHSEVRWQVVIDVRQFDTDLQGRSVLQASWQLYRQPEGRLVVSKTSHLVTHVQGAFDYDNIVAAMSHNLSGLSHDIAMQIRDNVPRSRDLRHYS